ncbi:GFA family protein [Vibrio vulnificus]|nr:GFA family protein [Vibrio vulnificus]
MANNKVRTCECECGLVKVHCQGDPVKTSICHSFECQRRLGSFYGVHARFMTEQIQLDGDVASFNRLANNGHEISYHFCPACSTTMLLLFSSAPAAVVVPMARFREETFFNHLSGTYFHQQRKWLQNKTPQKP